MTMTFKEALIAHLQGEKVDVREGDGYSWQAFGEYYSQTRLETFTTKGYAAGFQFRLAPRTILVNGVEVPAPEMVSPEDGVDFYVPDLAEADLFSEGNWDEAEWDLNALDRGLVYLDKESAIARAKAMLITQEVK